MARLSHAKLLELTKQYRFLMAVGRGLEAHAVSREIGTYRSRGKGRGTPSRRYGNPEGAYTPHQGRQERMRRLVGGFRGDKAVMVAKLQPVLRRAA